MAIFLGLSLLPRDEPSARSELTCRNDERCQPSSISTQPSESSEGTPRAKASPCPRLGKKDPAPLQPSWASADVYQKRGTLSPTSEVIQSPFEMENSVCGVRANRLHDAEPPLVGFLARSR